MSVLCLGRVCVSVKYIRLIKQALRVGTVNVSWRYNLYMGQFLFSQNVWADIAVLD